MEAERSETVPPPPIATPARPERLASLDAYRGFTMLAMASAGLGLARLAEAHPDSGFWQGVAYHVSHAEWVGCAVWDLIQPSFMFMVGVSLAYSYGARQARGESRGAMLRHAVIRAVILTLLGVFLRSNGKPETYWTFEDVVSQIGLGYVFLFLLRGRGARVQLGAAAAILAAYWTLFAFWPLPGPDFDYKAVGADPSSPFWLHGFAAHWNKNTNPAHAFDVWFLNLFPRARPFTHNGGGYQTLSFIPSLATMIFGLVAGELLRSSRRGAVKAWTLFGCGAAALAAGWGLGELGVCPVVKRIWTPSWAIFSTGWTLILLGGFHVAIDLWRLRAWAWPGIVVGMNSIAMYVMSWLFPGWVRGTLQTHMGQDIFSRSGAQYEELLQRSLVLLVLFLFCFWLYRRRIFLRV